jgi:hypothetical protein
LRLQRAFDDCRSIDAIARHSRPLPTVAYPLSDEAGPRDQRHLQGWVNFKVGPGLVAFAAFVSIVRQQIWCKAT